LSFQAVCDSNLTQTPRILSPNVPRQQQGHTNLGSSPVLSRARHHQPDPEVFSVDSDSDDGPSRMTDNSRNSYMSSFGVDQHSTRGNNSTHGTGLRKTSDSNLSRNSKARAKRTLDDLVNNPIPLGPTDYLSRAPTENRRERSTAFRPSKDTSIGGTNTRRMNTTTGPSRGRSL
jgi:hypothetical protein